MTNDDANAEQTSRKIKQLTAERDKLKAVLEKLIHLDDTSYLTLYWGLSSKQLGMIYEALKESA